MKIKEIPFGDLTLDRQEIYRTMGSGNYVPDEEMIRRVEGIIAETARICRPRFCYGLFPVEEVSTRRIVAGGCTFQTGSLIARCLKGSRQAALFVATSGREFDNWLHGLETESDIVRQFVADAVGSEIAEATARAVAGDLNEYAGEQGLAISNSYSPGYCGWHVRDQQVLFSLLPPDPCGVRLNDSSLMSPIKSVSGIIGLGREIQKMPYGCAVCGKKDCYKNKEK